MYGMENGIANTQVMRFRPNARQKPIEPAGPGVTHGDAQRHLADGLAAARSVHGAA